MNIVKDQDKIKALDQVINNDKNGQSHKFKLYYSETKNHYVVNFNDNYLLISNNFELLLENNYYLKLNKLITLAKNNWKWILKFFIDTNILVINKSTGVNIASAEAKNSLSISLNNSLKDYSLKQIEHLASFIQSIEILLRPSEFQNANLFNQDAIKTAMNEKFLADLNENWKLKFMDIESSKVYFKLTKNKPTIETNWFFVLNDNDNDNLVSKAFEFDLLTVINLKSELGQFLTTQAYQQLLKINGEDFNQEHLKLF